MRCYTQLTQEERYQIYGHLKAGYNISEIAEEMGRHRSTISREIKRNSVNAVTVPPRPTGLPVGAAMLP